METLVIKDNCVSGSITDCCKSDYEVCYGEIWEYKYFALFCSYCGRHIGSIDAKTFV